MKITGSIRTDPAQAEAYRQGYALYRDLDPALKPGFRKIAIEFQR